MNISVFLETTTTKTFAWIYRGKQMRYISRFGTHKKKCCLFLRHFELALCKGSQTLHLPHYKSSVVLQRPSRLRDRWRLRVTLARGLLPRSLNFFFFWIVFPLCPQWGTHQRQCLFGGVYEPHVLERPVTVIVGDSCLCCCVTCFTCDVNRDL